MSNNTPPPNTYVVEDNGKQYAIKVKNSNVNMEDVDEKLKSFLTKFSDLTGAEGLFPDVELLITSGNDSAHGKKSKHYIGGAVDLRIPAKYRTDRASVYKSPIYKAFQTKEVKDLMSEYGLHALDPLHAKFDSEEKTVQNAHMHLEFGNGHFVGDGHNHSKTSNKIEDGKDYNLKLRNNTEGGFDGEVTYEMYLNSIENKSKLKKDSIKENIKSIISNKTGKLTNFAHKKAESETESDLTIPLIKVNTTLNNLDGTSDIPLGMLNLVEENNKKEARGKWRQI